ncbi:MAG: diacylglycerol/polyprenol kinase family protein [Candidatus Helarchaeota archaeon]
MTDVIVFLGIFLTIVTFLFNIGISIAQTRRSYRLHHAESFYSLCLCVFALIFSFIVVMNFIIFDFLYGFIVTLTAGIVFLLFGIFNVIQYLLDRRKSSPSHSEIDFSTRDNLRHEIFRKIFHIILFFGIIALLLIGYLIIESLYLQGSDLPGVEETYHNYWGRLDGLGMWNIQFNFGQSVIFMLFILLTTIFVMNEGARLLKWFYFPLRKLASFGIREKEKDTVASYVYFTIGMVFAATFIYPLPLFSIIGILCFADTAASLFGRKYGRHKLSFNPTKSWEGSIGGFIVCLIVTILIVGPIWGICATIVFFVIDAITPKIPISDNIGIPVGVALTYFLLSILQIPMQSIVFSLL